MKLTDNQRDEIIKRATQGIAVAKLAKDFDVTPATIYHVLKAAERAKDFLEDSKANEIEREQILFQGAQSEADLWKTKFESANEDNQHLKNMFAETHLQLYKADLHKNRLR